MLEVLSQLVPYGRRGVIRSVIEVEACALLEALKAMQQKGLTSYF
jgi:hypothetical protein